MPQKSRPVCLRLEIHASKVTLTLLSFTMLMISVMGILHILYNGIRVCLDKNGKIHLSRCLVASACPLKIQVAGLVVILDTGVNFVPPLGSA